MQKLVPTLIFSLIGINSFTQTSSEVETFFEKQSEPFLDGTAEVFICEGTAWERPYGEKEFVLTPLVSNVSEHQNRIHSEDDELNGVIKSEFFFVKVPVNTYTKNELNHLDIYVPDYIVDSVIVYIPLLDIETLTELGIQIQYVSDYGTSQFQEPQKNAKMYRAQIYSKDFETEAFPGTQWQTSVGTINCGWDDQNCFAHNSTWALWCADEGAGCNSACTQYPNDMGSQFYTTNFISTTGYIDLWFKYWLEFDLYNVGSNDELSRYYDIGSGWVLSSTSYTSAHANDEQGWNQESFFYSGSFTGYAYNFYFYSNGTGNSYGVYLDDITLEGTQSSGASIDESEEDLISIFPNPANEALTIQLNNMKIIEFYNINGQLLKTLNADKNEAVVDISDLSTGVYFINVIDNLDNVFKRRITVN